MIFEIPFRRYVVDPGEELGVVRAKHLLDLGQAPHIELPLLALAVGVERRGKAPAFGDHLAHQPVDGLARADREQRIAGLAPRLGHQLEQQRVVVEHLLEMRHEPALVHAVAGEAAAEMIVDAALRDMGEGERHRLDRIGQSVAETGAPQEGEELRLRKFRRAPDAAMCRVDELEQTPREILERSVARDRAGTRLELRRQRLLQRRRVLPHLVRLVAIDARDLLQHMRKGRPAVARVLGEVRAAPERLGVGGEEHGERPAALLAELVQRRHVDGVDVGTLLAVDLDVDEEVVHHLRGLAVLEALMRHHVAPMAGGVADREQDGLARALGLGERLWPPRPPMHRVLLVLEEIGARLAAETVSFARALLYRGVCHLVSNRL